MAYQTIVGKTYLLVESLRKKGFGVDFFPVIPSPLAKPKFIRDNNQDNKRNVIGIVNLLSVECYSQQSKLQEFLDNSPCLEPRK